jgi:hypothetical protein
MRLGKNVKVHFTLEIEFLLEVGSANIQVLSALQDRVSSFRGGRRSETERVFGDCCFHREQA